MPRPSKRVPPNTLGGRIRAARQNLRLSLAKVAGDKYSTSLLSQIERNRIDPSLESLQYLAERLELPFEELQDLAEHQRQSEAEAHRYKNYEEQRLQASELLRTNSPRLALEQLRNLIIAQIPTYLRWQILALRGECYFSLRQFVPAQRDFLSAIAVLPETIPQPRELEAIVLRVHLAAATRELGQLEAAFEQYQDVLYMLNTSTPLRYIAETHWGMALVIFEQASDGTSYRDTTSDLSDEQKSRMQAALEHAEKACMLYSSIGETLRSALLNCQIALIEQSLGNLSEAGKRLGAVLDTWVPTLSQPDAPRFPSSTNKIGQYTLKERANVVSAAACYLAGVEHENHRCDEALGYIQLALDAGKLSYILRRAEAYMMLGQILADRNLADPKAEEAFQNAIDELRSTDRLAAKIRAHDLLGWHLLKQGKTREAQKQLDEARRLSNIFTGFTSATTSAEDISSNG